MLKKILHKAFYLLEEALCLFLFSKKSETLIVVRTDAIGDYILFRNFIKPLHEKYGKFTLVGNLTYQKLALQLDGEYIKEFIAIDHKKFLKNPFYRLKTIKILRQSSYEILVNSIYSRDRVSEDIVKIIHAKEKIGSVGDCSNLAENIKQKYDKNYTILLPAKNEVMFEFYRNLEFFRNLLTTNLHVDFFLDIKNANNAIKKFHLISPYSILFIGASAQYRKWGNDNFCKIGKFLHNTFCENIVICGGKEDFENGENIRKKLEKQSVQCINLCGKTSLIELVKIVYHSNYLISNETSCVHIAQAIRHDKTFVISNGNHLHRFVPYPKKLGKGYNAIFHPSIQKNLSDSVINLNYSGKISLLNINEINAESVIQRIMQNPPR